MIKLETSIVLLLMVLASSCKNQTASGQRNPDHQIISTTPNAIDSDFNAFLTHFSQDSLFQISRIDFPLEVTNIEENDEEVRIKITLADFHMLKFGDFATASREVDKYEEKIKAKRNKAIIEIRGIDNGIYIDIFFEKSNGKWMLKTWTDSST